MCVCTMREQREGSRAKIHFARNLERGDGRSRGKLVGVGLGVRVVTMWVRDGVLQKEVGFVVGVVVWTSGGRGCESGEQY